MFIFRRSFTLCGLLRSRSDCNAVLSQHTTQPYIRVNLLFVWWLFIWTGTFYYTCIYIVNCIAPPLLSKICGELLCVFMHIEEEEEEELLTMLPLSLDCRDPSAVDLELMLCASLFGSEYYVVVNAYRK